MRPSWISDLNDFSSSFESFGLSVQKKKRKIYFQDGGHGGHFEFSIETILAILDLQITPMLPTKFRVNWPFGPGEVKNRFSRRPPRQPSWISDRNYLLFDLQVSLMLATMFQVKWPFGSGEEAKNR